MYNIKLLKESEYSMEITQENINKVANILKIGKFNESLLVVQEYSKIAENLIDKFPNISVNELGKKYEEIVLKDVEDKIQEY